jgi:UDP-glucose 4-epimerase
VEQPNPSANGAPRLKAPVSAPISLVTGGAGFIGSHVVDELLKAGHEVVALDDLSGGFRDNVNPAAKFVKGSVDDDQLVEQLYSTHCFDYVFHLAAYAAEGLSHFIRRFNYTNNLIGSVTLMNAAIRHGCRCFVFTSSIAVYGSGQTPMTEERTGRGSVPLCAFSEDMTPAPEDPYGIAKYAVELDLASAHHLFGLNYIVLRAHNVYGERQNIGDKYRNVIGIFMNQVMQGLPCTIFGDGLQTRAFTHIADIAPAIAKSIDIPEAYGQIFNLGADTPYTVADLAEMVQKSMGRRTGIQRLEARNEVVHAHSDHGKARRILGCHPSISLETGLTRMAQWAWSVGPRRSQEFGHIEVERSLPGSWVKQPQQQSSESQECTTATGSAL